MAAVHDNDRVIAPTTVLTNRETLAEKFDPLQASGFAIRTVCGRLPFMHRTVPRPPAKPTTTAIRDVHDRTSEYGILLD